MVVVLSVLAAYAVMAPRDTSAQQVVVPPPSILFPIGPSQVAAVQAVIRRANDEQTQAVATGDPTVMRDTATAAYYRRLLETNQALAAQGATAIKLIAFTSGPVTVSDDTATATTTETWTITFRDGTTAQSVEDNLYTLVRQDGGWLIDAAQQASPTPLPTPSAVPTPSPVPAGQHTSVNWSGYVATSGRFTGVTGTWNVPQPRLTGMANGQGATWVGVGGALGRDLIQAGTQEVTDGRGRAQFQSWIELLPQAPQPVPLAVVAGDSVTISIQEQGAGIGVWQIAMANNTSGDVFQTMVQYASSESSAEWIDEAPSNQRGVLPIDNFGSVTFTGASAVRNGQTVNLTKAGAQPITMVNALGQPLAQPSTIGGDGSSFTITRTSALATPGGRVGRPARAARPVRRALVPPA
jgi:hypothetical protein